MWPAAHPACAFAKCLGAAGALIGRSYSPLHYTGAKQSEQRRKAEQVLGS